MPRPAVLDGIDTDGLAQECVSSDPALGASLFRFYLPDGVTLDDLSLHDATDRGVSWTQVSLDTPAQTIDTTDRPDAVSGGVTTVRWTDALAVVHRWGPARTEVTWIDPHGNTSADGSAPALVRAVVAAEPVTAVRAAVGFVNQGGIRVARGDDGTLLLVPGSEPGLQMQALNHGTLVRTPEGCLVLDHGERGVQLVLWPYGTTWDAAAQVLTVPAERGGDLTYRVGDEVSLGGGESDGQCARALVPGACASDEVWIGGSAVVLPAS